MHEKLTMNFLFRYQIRLSCNAYSKRVVLPNNFSALCIITRKFVCLLVMEHHWYDQIKDILMRCELQENCNKSYCMYSVESHDLLSIFPTDLWRKMQLNVTLSLHNGKSERCNPYTCITTMYEYTYLTHIWWSEVTKKIHSFVIWNYCVVW